MDAIKQVLSRIVGAIAKLRDANRQLFNLVLGAVLVSSTPSQAGALTSALNMFVIGSALLGPIAFGAVAEGFGYSGAFIALAVVCIAGAVSCALGRMIDRTASGELGRQSLPAA